MAWLSTYKYRFKMLIPAGTVTDTLTVFPVSVNLDLTSGINQKDTTFIFEVCRDNYLKIAVTDSDGTTQLYAEIEKWDYANGNGLIHFKKPSITVSDNYYYIYFDDEQADNTTYIGLAGSIVSQNVWDSSFDFALNFSDSNPATFVVDSAKGGTYATSGSMTSADIVDGNTGKAIEFDGVDDYISFAGSHSSTTDGTLEMMVKINPESAGGGLWSSTLLDPQGPPDYDQDFYLKRLRFEDNKFFIGQRAPDIYETTGGDGAGGELKVHIETSTEISGAVQLYERWLHIVSTPTHFFLNGVSYAPYHYSYSFIFYSQNQKLPHVIPYNAPINGIAGALNYYPIPALTCQSIRMSTTNRSNDWIAASYLNIIDELTQLEHVEFYENIVNGVLFDTIGSIHGPRYFYLIVVHDSYSDLIIPIDNFQFSHNAGNKAYLSVAIKDLSYDTELIARDGGQLRLHMLAYGVTEFERDNMIIQVDFDADSIDYDYGANSQTMTVDGYGIFGSRYLSLTLDNCTYRRYARDGAKHRFRFPMPFYFFRTNDTVTVNGFEIQALSVTGNGSPAGCTLEISNG